MKKIAFIILAMLLPLMANAATTTFKVDGISYETLEDDNQAVKVINGNTKYSGDVVIPATVTSGGKTYTVKKIGKWAFWECTGLKSIVLPEGLVEIENSSFTGCTGLKALTIPTSVVSIDGTAWSDDRGAFEGCTGLKSVYFPSTMKVSQLYEANIGGRAFYGCTGLKTIYVAGSETAIAMYDVFGGCTAVTDFVSCIQNPKATYVDVRSFQGFIETANLIVPDGKKSDYQGSNDWYLFKHIYERSSYTKAFAIVKASQGGKVSYSNESVTIGTQVWGIAKGQSATFTITPDEGHKLLKLLKDGVDVTSSVSNGQYTVSNVQSDFTLEAFFEEGTTPTPQPQTQDKGTAKLSIESFEIKAGETKTMLIDMQNPEDQVTLVQFDLRLPDGLSIASDDDAIDIAGRTTWKKHTLTSNATNGITRILLYSSTNAVIDGTSGAIISIKLTASSSFKGGDVKLENQLMTTPSLVESKPAVYTYNIKGGGDNPPVGDAEPYVVFNNGTLTFYYDKQRSSRQGTKYDLNEGNEKPGWSENANNITSVVFDASFANARPKSTYYWFNGAESLSDIIDIKYLNTSNVTIMSYMFTACSSLTSLDVSNFNTSNVTNMGGMFDHCRGLKSLDVSNFNTSNVTEMWQMFLGCSGLTSLDVSNFNTSNVTKIQWIFANCSGLTSLDVSNFNTNNVTDMGAMFYGCSGLTSLDVSNFNTDNVTTMHYMFSGCSGLTSLDVSMFNTSNLKNMSEMFLGCSGLTSLDVSNFNTSNVKDMSKMFYNCSGLTTIYAGDKWSTANVTSGEDMFSGCKKLIGGKGTAYDASHIDYTYARIDGGFDAPGYLSEGSNILKVGYVVFDSATGTLTFKYGEKPDGDNVYDTDNTQNKPGWQSHNADIKKVVFDASFANARPKSTAYWFCKANNLSDIVDIKYLNTSNVTSMFNMFFECSSLTSLDVSKFVTTNVTTMVQMFYNCKGLKSLDVSNFNTSNVTSMYFMFLGCSGLTSLDVINFNTSNVTNMRGIFWGCRGLASLDVSKFNTSNVTYMNNMFCGCSGLTSLDVSNFNTSNVTDMKNMFSGCSGLTTIYAGDKWSTANVTSGEDMFSGCTNLVGGNGTKYDANHVDVEYARIDKAGAPGYFTDRNGGTEPVGDAKPYVVYNNGTLTFYCDNQRSSKQGTTYDLNESYIDPLWYKEHAHDIKKAVFDKSFANARPTKTHRWFEDCYYLTDIQGIENLNTSEVTYMLCMFANCRALESIDLRSFDVSKVGEFHGMFLNCKNLKKLDFSGFNTENLYNMYAMFTGCENLTEINLEDFDTKGVKYMNQLFQNCKSLETLSFGEKFVSNEKTECDLAFDGCKNLKKINFSGNIPESINSKFFEGVGTADSPVMLNVPEQYRDNYVAKFVGNMFYGGYFTLREAIVPNDENGGKDYGNGNGEIDENTDLNGSIIGNVYYNIAPENGGYNAAEGCLVVTKPSSDFEGEDPFGDDFKGMFTGIVIMVQPGSGTVKVEAETSGGMSLMVKVGNNQPIKMSFQSKSTLAIPYNVDRPTYVYIYAGGVSATRAGSENALKIYSVSWESTASDISDCIDDGQPFDVYSLSGTLVKKGATSLKSLPKGAYIVNRRKVMVK